MSYPFFCDHCKKRFERETPEAPECPFCFWTSSVQREEEPISEKKKTSCVSPKNAFRPDRKTFLENFSGNSGYLFRTLLFLALFSAVGFLGYKAYTLWSSSSRSREIFSIKPQKDKDFSRTASPVPGLAAVSAQEKEALYREVTIPADRTPDPSEQMILNRVVPFQTGWTEKLPSAAWTLEQYRKLIVDREAFYKMPFARSYKKKLEELFKAQYLAAVDAFGKGDILSARNLWVESLTFPLYSTDLKKHRAVALTMLRPFINDTLSKVSAMNQTLADKEKRIREEAVSAEYQKLGGMIARKQWKDALSLIAPMTAEVNELRKNAKPREVPSYPPSFGTIDADLQQPLMDLMAPAPSSTADLQPLQQDLVEKKEVLETFTESYFKNATALYQSAMVLIHEQKWQEAAQTLGSIRGPQVLQQDAAQKIAILEKMTLLKPDSSGKIP